MANIRNLDELRSWYGKEGEGLSDEDMLKGFANVVGKNPHEVGATLGYDPGAGGMSAKRLASSIDTYQAGMYGVGEAIASKVGLQGTSDFLKRQREENEYQAGVAGTRAGMMGAIDKWSDVHGVSDFGNYAAGLGIQSLPYLAEAGAGALTGGATLPSTLGRFALTRAARGTAGAVAASYPSSVGDVLQNQRDQAGTTDLGVAGAMGVPYALANAFGVEGAIARGGLLRSGVKALDDITGLKGIAARTGATALKTGTVEGASETFQEGLNQIGRMAVDPNEDFFTPRSEEAFKESFIGGAVLGGVASAPTGGMRSEEYHNARRAQQLADASRPTELLGAGAAAPPPLGIDRQQALALGAEHEVGPHTMLGAPPGAPVSPADTAALQEQLSRAKQFMAQAANEGNTEEFYRAQDIVGRLEAQLPRVGIADQGAAPPARDTATSDMFAAEATALPAGAPPTTGVGAAPAAPPSKVYTPEEQELMTLGVANHGTKAMDIHREAKASGLPSERLAPVYAALALNRFSPAKKALTRAIVDAKAGKPIAVPKAPAVAPAGVAPVAAAPVVPAGVAPVPAAPAVVVTPPVPLMPGAGPGAGAKRVKAAKPAPAAPVAAAPVVAPPVTPAAPAPTKEEKIAAIAAQELPPLPPAAPALDTRAVRHPSAGQPRPPIGEAPKAPTKPGITAAPKPKAKADTRAVPHPSAGQPRPPVGEAPKPAAKPEITAAPKPAPEPVAAGAVGEPQAARPAIREPQGERVVQRKRKVTVTPAAPVAAYVAPEKMEEAPAPRAPEPEEREDEDVSDEDALEIARATGRGEAADVVEAEEAGTRIETVGATEEEVAEAETRLIETRFPADTHEYERNRKVAKAYLLQMRHAPYGHKVKLTKAIARQYGIEAVTVREIGNTQELIKAGGVLGMSEQEVRSLLDIEDTSRAKKKEGTSAEKAQAEERAGTAADKGKAIALAEAGFGTEEESGMGGEDKSKLWKAGAAGMGDIANIKDEALANKVDGALAAATKMRNAAAELAAEGNTESAAEAQAMADMLDSSREAALAEYEKHASAKAKKKSAALTKDLKVKQKAGKTREQEVAEEQAEEAEEEVAPADRPEAVEEVRTLREQAAEAWEEAVEETPAIPHWADLSAEQQRTFTEFGEGNWTHADVVHFVQQSAAPAAKAKLAAAAPAPDAETILDQPVENTPAEQSAEAIIDKALIVLEPAERQQLATHYGEKTFNKKAKNALIKDVRAYVIKGAAAVAEAIRATVAKVAAVVMATSIVFNPLGMKNAEAMVTGGEVTRTYATTTTTVKKWTVPSNINAQLSPAARVTSPTVGAHAMAQGKWFLLADKPKARLHIFDAQGKHQYSGPTLYGASEGDLLRDAGKTVEQMGPADKVTPAGVFSISVAKDAEYTGGVILKMPETVNMQNGRAVSFIAIHSVYTGTPAEKRAQRLASGEAAVSKISYGCINTAEADFLQKIMPHAASLDGALVSITPDNQMRALQYMRGKVTGDYAQRIAVPETTETKTETKTVTTVHDVARGEGTKEAAPGIGRGRTVPAARTSTGGRRRSKVDDVELSLDDDSKGPRYTAKGLTRSLKGFLRMGVLGKNVIVVDGIADIRKLPEFAGLNDKQFAALGIDPRGQAFVSNRTQRAYFMANNIKMGNGRAVFMHEVGGHFGLQTLPDEVFNPLVERMKAWAMTDDGSVESQIAARAVGRVFTAEVADTKAWDNAKKRRELVAYFLEEALKAGVNPSEIKGPFGTFVRRVINAFKAALSKFMDMNSVTAQDIVDVAYGFAQLKVTDRADTATATTSADLEFSLPPQVQATTNKITRIIAGQARRASNIASFTNDLIERGVNVGLAGAKDLQRIYQERTALAGSIEREVDRVGQLYDAVPTAEKGTGATSVNRYIYDSTREGKWGFAPDWRVTKPPIDAESRARFNRLSPQSQALVKAMFKHGDDMLQNKKDAVMRAADSEYAELIDRARAANDTAKVSRLEAAKRAQLKQFNTLFGISEHKPYAPMKRYGDWVVVAQSAKYQAADATGKRALEDDPDHYHVSFAESEASGLELQRELEGEGHFAKISVRQKEQERGQMYGGALATLTELRKTVDAEIENAPSKSAKAAATRMREIVTRLYLTSLAENSARKSEMKRRGVAGEIDMLRSFMTQGRADANFVATTKYADPSAKALNTMRRQVREGSGTTETARSEIFNELLERHLGSLGHEPAPLVEKVQRLTSFWYLVTSPAYYLQNLTQPFMLSLPYIAGRHNYLKAADALVKGYRDLLPMLKGQKLGDQINIDAAPPELRAMLKTLADRGRIDISLESELGRFRVGGDSKLSDAWNKVDGGLRNLVQKAESVNRLSTAVAAYRMELARTGDAAKATEYADEVIAKTHGDYTRINAPRAFNTSAGKVLLQFRKFQLIQLSLLAKLVKNSFTGQDRWAARKALGYTLAHVGAMSGVVGAPGYMAATWLYGALFGDEDEPDDPEGTMREFIGDPDLAMLITRGIPAYLGADLSAKIGMGAALSVVPYADVKFDRESMKDVIAAAAGPFAGLLIKAGAGIGMINEGNYYKGMEQLLPTGVAGAMKAYRFATEGVTRPNTDVLLSPEEINIAEAALTALGLQTREISERNVRSQSKYATEEHFKARSTEVKQQYLRARKSGDPEDVREARDAWTKLQQTRRQYGFKAEPQSTLLKAEQAQKKRERATIQGIQYDRRSKGYVEELTAQ